MTDRHPELPELPDPPAEVELLEVAEPKPLGMPIGSVRAILAIGLVAATIGLAFLGVVDGTKVADLAMVVAAFYFATRQA